jgi:hypothetical protein
MWKAKTLQHEGAHISASLKAVVLVTVIGICASLLVAFEVPRLIAAPEVPVAMTATIYVPAAEPSPVPAVRARASPEARADADEQRPAIASK